MTRIKVLFNLESDETGYPPCNVESLWCILVEDKLCQVDNVPFFVCGIALGDIIRIDQGGNFLSIDRPSGNLTIRIYTENMALRDSLKKELTNRGCVWEQSHIKYLAAVGIPNALKNEVVSILEHYKGNELEYEVGN